jgi:hypothetical protein
VKRYVAGTDADGRSTLVADGGPGRIWGWGATATMSPHAARRTILSEIEAGESAGATAELWTLRLTPDGVQQEDPADYQDAPGASSLDCPPGVIRWCVTRFGPGYESKMHTTHTIDLDVVLDGELELVLDDGSVVLGPGDGVVVPGVRHAWRTKSGATFLYCLVSPAPVSR